MEALSNEELISSKLADSLYILSEATHFSIMTYLNYLS